MNGSNLVLPAVLGRYTLLERVGGGGMASVYRSSFSVDGGFEKEVAVKVIRAELATDPVFTEMFQDEARISARLAHANLVQTFDFGQVDGVFFLAMEYVRGRTLANLLRTCLTLGKPLGIPLSVHVVAEVARGLGFAHRLEASDGTPLGLVHRDVSPQNVLISREGEVKLTDFGIAKAAERTHVTQPGKVRGKCAYMAPEQARGLGVDARTDVFSLGIVLWECLARRPLFDGPSDGAVLLQVIQREIAPPSRFDQEIPPDLDDLVLRMLSRDPMGRPANGDEVARELAGMNLRLVQSLDQIDLAGFLRGLSTGTAAWPVAPGAEQGAASLVFGPRDPVVHTEATRKKVPGPAVGDEGPRAFVDLDAETLVRETTGEGGAGVDVAPVGGAVAGPGAGVAPVGGVAARADADVAAGRSDPARVRRQWPAWVAVGAGILVVGWAAAFAGFSDDVASDAIADRTGTEAVSATAGIPSTAGSNGGHDVQVAPDPTLVSVGEGDDLAVGVTHHEVSSPSANRNDEQAPMKAASLDEGAGADGEGTAARTGPSQASAGGGEPQTAPTAARAPAGRQKATPTSLREGRTPQGAPASRATPATEVASSPGSRTGGAVPAPAQGEATGTLILSSKMAGEVAVLIDGSQRIEIAPHVPIPISVPAGRRTLLFELGRNGLRCSISAEVQGAGRHSLQLQADGQVVRLTKDGRFPVPCGS